MNKMQYNKYIIYYILFVLRTNKVYSSPITDIIIHSSHSFWKGKKKKKKNPFIKWYFKYIEVTN